MFRSSDVEMRPSAAGDLHRGSLSSSFYQDFAELKWYHKVPVINIIHDVLLDAPPTVDQLKDTLNLIALETSLMLSVVRLKNFRVEGVNSVTGGEGGNEIAYTHLLVV